MVPRSTVSTMNHWEADAALTEVYALHWTSLVRTAHLLVRDQGLAEEITQDAFVAMHRHWSRLEDTSRALPYLRRAVVNRSRSALRHRTVVDKHLRRGLGERFFNAPDAAQEVLADERRSQVLDALARLPRRQREVLVLRHYMELSEAEIADALRISRGSVKSHASRGSAALRELLSHITVHRGEESHDA